MDDDLCAISRPLSSLKELNDWSPNDRSAYCRSRVPFCHAGNQNQRPKLLVCHDMKGGYLEDRFIQGVANSDCYRFNHWWSIDTFIYFSHHFVTLPPPCWIDAGHRHGVKVLGTLITEWKPGQEICEEFLKDEKMFQNAADQLVRMAQYYQFDGWLINIENKLSSEKTAALKDFLCYLTKQMHLQVRGSEVIWYDSIILDGSLSWQNELNDKNKCFFESCDGIFLNYTWNTGNLQSTAELAKSCGRLQDVYVGVDIFGRGCFGNGGFNTDAAMEVAASLDLSVALFGIGWTHEKLEAGQSFTENDEGFWNLLQKFCVERRVASLPLVTSFCQGWGKRYYCRGQALDDKPWTSLSLQQLQPTDECTTDVKQYVTSDAYFGGGCLECKQNMDGYSAIRLFSLDVTLTDDIFVSYTHKMVVSGQFLIVISLKKGTESIIFGLPNNGSHREDIVVSKKNISMIKSSDERVIPTDNGSWITRNFCLSDVNSCQLEEISVVFLDNPDPCVFRLGELQVKPRSGVSDCDRNTLKSRHNWTVNGQLSLAKALPSTADVTPEAEPTGILTENSRENQTESKSSASESPNGENLLNKDNERTVQPTEICAIFREKLDLTWDLPDDTLGEISRFHVFLHSLKDQAWRFLGHTPICSFSCYLSNGTKDFDLTRFKLDAVLVNEDIIIDINVTI